MTTTPRIDLPSNLAQKRLAKCIGVFDLSDVSITSLRDPEFDMRCELLRSRAKCEKFKNDPKNPPESTKTSKR
eukprot:274259-Amphidinium_carterae.1